jgi:transcriptional regulator with XRE-family HTH domain
MSDIEVGMMRPRIVTGRQQFGAIMRAARQTNGLTATRLAALLGLVPSAVSQRELGVRGIAVDDAVAVLRSLGYAVVVMPDDEAAALVGGDR